MCDVLKIFINLTFIRPILEQSAPVWHSSLTEENSEDLERVQKAAARLIMGGYHMSYKSSLKELHLETLKEYSISRFFFIYQICWNLVYLLNCMIICISNN
mgnify:CR=1 FL=1